MMRSTSILIALLFVIVATSNLERVQGLAGMVRRFRNTNGRFGWGVERRSNSLPRAVPVVVEASKGSTTRADVTAPATPIVVSVEAFDAGSYRREMINLVYQRNMERLNAFE
jgi:hypothetical protein